MEKKQEIKSTIQSQAISNINQKNISKQPDYLKMIGDIATSLTEINPNSELNIYAFEYGLVQIGELANHALKCRFLMKLKKN